jgi:outer membrane lipoprotein-sorting protein
MLRLAFVVCIVLAPATNMFAQETAASLTKRLEDQLLSSAAVSMKFTIATEGPVSVTANLRDKKIRMESPSMLIISDGTTIWNYQKHADRVTIDNVSGMNSPFRDPQSVFKFSENYTTRILSANDPNYRMEFTPNAQLSSFMQSAGDMQRLILDLNVRGKNITIMKAAVSSSRGTSQTSALTIKPLKSVRAADFVFAPKSNTKVLDLR